MARQSRRTLHGIDIAGRPRVRALAAALRRERTEAKFSAREVSRRLELAHTTISQWETGQRVPSLEDVASYLTILHITGQRREAILELARDAHSPDWLTVGMPGIAQQLAGTIECERMATKITVWAPTVVPGLLQTSEYARALIASDKLVSPQEVEKRVMVRASRRDVLDWPNTVQYHALIGEQALHEIIGEDPMVTINQLRALRVLPAQNPRVSIRVVQPNRGWHPGLAGQFVLYDFMEAPSIVLLEHHRTGAFIYEPSDVDAYHAAVNEIETLAMRPAESGELMAGIADEMERKYDDHQVAQGKS